MENRANYNNVYDLVYFMSDEEIEEYLTRNNYVVDAQDCLMKVLNTSRQIIERNYDFETSLMTLKTPDNVFTFLWKLK